MFALRRFICRVHNTCTHPHTGPHTYCTLYAPATILRNTLLQHTTVPTFATQPLPHFTLTYALTTLHMLHYTSYITLCHTTSHYIHTYTPLTHRTTTVYCTPTPGTEEVITERPDENATRPESSAPQVVLREHEVNLAGAASHVNLDHEGRTLNMNEGFSPLADRERPTGNSDVFEDAMVRLQRREKGTCVGVLSSS